MNTTQFFPADRTPDVIARLVLEEEKAYRDQIRRSAEKALQDKVRFVFLAGPSCSGKTTTSLLLSEVFQEHGKRVATLSTDDFFFDGKNAPLNEDGTPNYDAFEHIDSRYLVRVIRRFSQGKNALLPLFDFKLARRKKETLPLSPSNVDILIVEGIHALNDVILSALDPTEPCARLYLNVTLSLAGAHDIPPLSPIERRFCRRLIRDYKHRFAPADLSFSLWDNAVRAESLILHPFLANATDTLTTNFTYEIGVEKEEALALLSQVTEDSPFFPKALALRDKLSAFPSLPATLVPPNSVLREFID